MKKRLVSVAIASLLIISMCVPASAKSVFVQTSPNGGGYWAVVPDDNNNGSSSSGSSSSSGTTNPAGSNAGSGQGGQTATFTTPTGQPITDSLVTMLASSQESTGPVKPVSKNTLIAYSNYIKSLGMNSALVTAFVPTGKPGPNAINNTLITKGLSYTVLVQYTNGKVDFIKPTSVDNGKLVYNKPAGDIASIAVVCNAVAPK